MSGPGVEGVVEEIFQNSEAYENLLVLADDIGPRLGGTENDLRARDFLLDTMNRYGLVEVRAESFPHRAWTPVEEELHLLAPEVRPIPCRCGGLLSVHGSEWCFRGRSLPGEG